MSLTLLDNRGYLRSPDFPQTELASRELPAGYANKTGFLRNHCNFVGIEPPKSRFFEKLRFSKKRATFPTRCRKSCLGNTPRRFPQTLFLKGKLLLSRFSRLRVKCTRNAKSPTQAGLCFYTRIETSNTFAAVDSAKISYSDHICRCIFFANITYPENFPARSIR